MPRAHWLIIAIGLALMLFASLNPDQRRPGSIALLPEAPTEESGLELGEPDLLLEGAVITQFRRDGSLQYRLHAEQIAHYPGIEQTMLVEPRLLLDQGSAAPWELSASRGRILGRSGLLLRSGTGLGAATQRSEQVQLDDNVLIHRQSGEERFINLSTSSLTLFPEHEYAETDRPVIIDTEAGRTTAANLKADLARGRLLLAAAGDVRVHTTITPEHLP